MGVLLLDLNLYKILLGIFLPLLLFLSLFHLLNRKNK
jgi:hypothetical protein